MAEDRKGLHLGLHLDDIADLPFGQAIADAARAAGEEEFSPDSPPQEVGAPADPQAELADAGAELEAQKARMAEVMAAMQALAERGDEGSQVRLLSGRGRLIRHR
mgnify:CR=1 FL=1